MNYRKGFTLIELLIVVAIIAILAAIAVPNFLEAQVRSKVSRVHSDLRSLANALEAYNLDNDSYIPMNWGGVQQSRYTRLARLTTPITYITTVLEDPFFMNEPTRGTVHPTGRNDHKAYAYWDPVYADAAKASATGSFRYLPEERMILGRWALFGCGPDRDYEPAGELGGSGPLNWYDPTNGTVSDGDIYRFGP